jgi:hypothetical protein
MNQNSSNDKPLPTDKPSVPPAAPYDPLNPEEPTPNQLPIPPDSNPKAPVREPEQPLPVSHPQPPEPTRLL